MDRLKSPVASLMRKVAAEVVLPRYQNLAAHEIVEKGADDLVTIADRESEARLHEGLVQLLPDAGVVGEEACAADPSILETVAQGLKWVIDPIDGTGNFAAGRAPFGIMVALVNGGETLGAWILDPLTDRLCHASRQSGATINDEPVMARESGASTPIVGISLLFVQPDDRLHLISRARGKLDMVDIPRCAAEQYPRVVLGQNDLAVFERTLPWDHAPGAFFLECAGGKVARTDGGIYRVGDNGRGLLAAASPAIWDKAAAILYG